MQYNLKATPDFIYLTFTPKTYTQVLETWTTFMFWFLRHGVNQAKLQNGLISFLAKVESELYVPFSFGDWTKLPLGGVQESSIFMIILFKILSWELIVYSGVVKASHCDATFHPFLGAPHI